MKLGDDTSAEEHIGGRDLTRWPTAVGCGLVRVVAGSAANISSHSVLYITAGVGLALVIGLTAAGAGIYDAVVEHDGISGLDQPALDQSIAHRTSTNTQLLTAFTHLGGPIGMTIIASVITIALGWRWRSRTPLILMPIAVAGSLTMTIVGKAIVGRVRPPLTEAVPPWAATRRLGLDAGEDGAKLPTPEAVPTSMPLRQAQERMALRFTSPVLG